MFNKRQFWIVFTSTICIMVMIITSQATISSDESAYLKGKKAIENKDWKGYQQAHKKLAGSPLKVYLEYYYHDAQLGQMPPEKLLQFIQKNKARAFYSALVNKFFLHQYRQKKYNFILQNSHLLTTQYLRCILYNTQRNQQPELFNINAFKKDWNDHLSIPNTCIDIENHWLNTEKPFLEIRTKVYKLYAINRISEGKRLASYLPKEERVFYDELAQLLQNPTSILTLKKYSQKASAFYALAINRWAKSNSLEAQKGLDLLNDKKALKQSDFITLRNQLAVFQAGRADTIDPLKRLLSIPDTEKSDEVRQWAFRIAAQNDCQLGLSLLKGMSAEAQKVETWTYWKGSMYECLGNKIDAEKEFNKIAENTSYYGFLASDKINKPYRKLTRLIKEVQPPLQSVVQRGYLLSLLLENVKENIFYRAEWNGALSRSSKREQHNASLLAFKHKRINLGITTAIRAREAGALSLRYPSYHLKTIEQYTKSDPLINTYAVLALIRQESLFKVDAKSNADAHGLMQLLIPTANSMSTLLKETKRDSLYNPEANIRYGITYLHYLKDNVGTCLPYIFASYNAGPNKVHEWKKKEINNFPLWIENIPYYETRNYVKTLLENMIIYHYLNNQPVKLHQFIDC